MPDLKCQHAAETAAAARRLRAAHPVHRRQHFSRLSFDRPHDSGRAELSATNPGLAQQDFEVAAKTIGLAVVLDGLDGRIARMTNTTSEFGRELDSLADVISFGIAPAILAYIWGVLFVSGPSGGSVTLDHLQRVGKFLAFLFLACGAARLARFNIQKNPVPPIPAHPIASISSACRFPPAAGMVAAMVFFFDSYPLTTSPGPLLGWSARAAVFPDGQRMALLELQGSESACGRARR